MPRRTDRQIRAANLLKGFIRFFREHARRKKRRVRRDARLRRQLNHSSHIDEELLVDTRLERLQFDDLAMEPTFDTESSGSSADSSSVTSEGSWESSDEEDEDSEGADESDDTDDESEWDLGIEGDVEDWDPEDDVEFPRVRATTHVDKHDRPDIFRRELRVSPYTFDRMVNRLLSDSVFSNNSQNEQMPVEDQLAITLYRFGHFGNAAGLDSVARWSGYAKGTVSLATRRVMTAILRKDFMDTAVQPPTQEEKERAKRWVERTSCKAWRDGWCMVDGTLVTLYDRPF
ncbi:hypothetical protein FPV67DRAFT_643871 [Lyophyllum atratum]|nr:hypothetical protein FPV67DRAFT_643871 [Lyophyllum atratum]